MGQLTQTFTASLAGFVDSGPVQLGLRLVILYVVVLWVASAVWVYRDLHDRTHQPLLPPLAALVVLAFTPLLFPFGLVIYRAVRPAERLAETETRELTQAALLSELDGSGTCPGCGRFTLAEWLACPSCGSRIGRRCPACERVAALDWSLCAWCAAELDPAPGLLPERTVRPFERPAGLGGLGDTDVSGAA